MIHLDLDDVTADYTGYVNKVFGTNYKIGDLKSDLHWKELCASHFRMFSDLEPVYEFVPVLQRIIDHCGVHNVAFLTALPYDDEYAWQYASYDKVCWVKEYVAKYIKPHGVDIPVVFGPYAHDKYKHCEIGDILIDDRKSNCEQWIAAGGIAHTYTNADDCVSFLKEQFPNI